ncbi:MAG: TIGR03759 family integrating conjugative element protein [Gammaproteobacteria bacterium]|nr:TIGR03759 family integrating conjugative element protein [Gammaproteobacteria bacterium]
MRFKLIVVLLLLFASALNAQTITQVNELSLDRTNTEVGISVPVHTTEAALWGLSNEEWERHLELLRGIRGRLSSEGISPIEVLGIHARNDAEREHYAEVWAQMMIMDAERVLKFQKAYDQAIREIAADMPLIDPELVPTKETNDEVELLPTDRIMYFTSLDCLACEVIYERTAQLLLEVDGIDVYFLGTSTDDHVQIRNWARERGIVPLDVRSNTITLNADNGSLKTLVPRMHEVPFLMLRRGEESLDFPIEKLQ